jgi:hypothetical protein
MKIQILTYKDLVTVRTELASNPAILFEGLEAICEKHGIELEDSEYEISDGVKLSIPEANADTISEKKDLENAWTVFESLSNLTPAHANDERLWVTLALGIFREYSLARWAGGVTEKSPKADIKKLLELHFYVSGSRDRWRNQAISRLWWQARYATYISPENPKLTLAILMSNSDLVAQVLGRPTISTANNVGAAVIKVCLQGFTGEGAKGWNRSRFRDFLKQVDLLSGRKLLNFLPSEELEAKIGALFIAAFE